MTDINLIRVTPNTDEWLKLRESSIGASESAVLLNLNYYETVGKLYAKKTGTAEPFHGNFKTKRGHHLEDSVANMFLEFTDMDISVDVMPDKGVRHLLEFPQLTCTIDRIVKEPAGVCVLECKTSGINTYKKWDAERVPMASYVIQVLQQINIGVQAGGLPYGYIVMDLAGEVLVAYRIDSQDPLAIELWGYVREMAVWFWSHVLAGETPVINDGIRERWRDIAAIEYSARKRICEQVLLMK